MTHSHLPMATWVAFGLGLAAAPIVSPASAHPAGVVHELVNRPSPVDHYVHLGEWNYDREVNGSDASTPGDK